MKRTLICLSIFATLSTAHAQFFGGYADGVTSFPTFTRNGSTQIVYDDFTFDVAGDIDSFALIGMSNLDLGSTAAIYYEIRSGVSSGNGGVLLFSGFFPGVVFSALPTDGSFGTPPAGATGTYGVLSAGVGAASAIHLAAGTYWIGLAPLASFGTFDVTSTQGLGGYGHPLNNGNGFDTNFASTGTNDWGLRIGTLASTVPEPSTVSLLGLAGLAVLCRRFRANR